MKRHDLFIALDAIAYALRLVESAAKPLATEVDQLESGSRVAVSVAFIKNSLSDAQNSLSAAEGEMTRLLHEGLDE